MQDIPLKANATLKSIIRRVLEKPFSDEFLVRKEAFAQLMQQVSDLEAQVQTLKAAQQDRNDKPIKCQAY